MGERIPRTHMMAESNSLRRSPSPRLRPRIAVVVPTLNEARRLPRLLPDLSRQADILVVSDGGSTDATSRIARGAGARIVVGPASRGGQLRRGAEAAGDADVLVFLHADTELSPNAISNLRDAVAAGFVGGGFLIRFDAPGLVYRLGSRLVNLRTRWSRLPLGDQAQWATRQAYELAGGFPDWPILEDVEFMRRLKRIGRVAVLPERVVTSARRYRQGGIVRTIATNWLIWLLYLLGVSPQRLSRLYPPQRSSTTGQK